MNTGRNPKLERILYGAGHIVGDGIGRVINRIRDSHRRAKEAREIREVRRQSNAHRQLPDWQVGVCERAVQNLLPHLPKTLAGEIQEPARQLCYDILVFEDKHKTVYIKKMEQFLSVILWNLVGGRLDIRLIGGESGEKTFSVPVHTLYRNVVDFIDAFGGILAHELLPPDGRPFRRLVAKYQYNLFVTSGLDPNREVDPIVKTSLRSN